MKNRNERVGGRFAAPKVVAAVMAVCLSAQPVFSFPALADTKEAAMSLEELGPGAVIPAWERLDGKYIDDQGSVIEGALLRGISVSKFQGVIDWGKVAADDVSFSMVRMVSYGYEGDYTMDETFDRNMREAKANGVHTAPYVYLQTKTVEEAKEAARFAVETAKNYSIDYPIAADIESKYLLELSVQELTDVVNAFCQVVAEAGYRPIVYSDYYKFTTEMDTAQIPYDIWLARYGGSNEYANRTMWQSTDKGKVDGIDGYVCLEFAFKDYAASSGAWSQTEGGAWYYYQGGNKAVGWLQLGDSWYYLDPAGDGAMVSGTAMTIDGVEYRFDENGVMQ